MLCHRIWQTDKWYGTQVYRRPYENDTKLFVHSYSQSSTEMNNLKLYSVSCVLSENGFLFEMQQWFPARVPSKMRRKSKQCKWAETGECGEKKPSNVGNGALLTLRHFILFMDCCILSFHSYVLHAIMFTCAIVPRRWRRCHTEEKME